MCRVSGEAMCSVSGEAADAPATFAKYAGFCWLYPMGVRQGIFLVRAPEFGTHYWNGVFQPAPVSIHTHAVRSKIFDSLQHE